MSDSERLEANERVIDKLTPAQERAVVALLSTSTLEEAAKEAKTSVATLRRWRQEKAFQKAWRTQRTALLESATSKLRKAAGDAVDTLTILLNSGRPEIRIRAAQTILNMAFRSAEVEELAERIEELDAEVAEWTEHYREVEKG